ncbi:MAG: response regulator [Bacteroidota bacterium]
MMNSTLKNARILIVDDQQANIDILEGLLEMQGYVNIRTTTDPRDVIPEYKLFKPDLLLLDLSMPFLSGFEVMEQLKANVPANTSLPILVLTADVTTESKQRALSGGASDFLTKPFDLVEVGLRIRNLLFTAYLLQQMENQNMLLEEKVMDRTAELAQNNIELKSALVKAEASDRLKTDFMNNISHEIRTPLNGILGFAPMIIDPTNTEEEKKEYLDILTMSSNRLMQTVSDYMDISLITSGNLEVRNKEFSLADIIEDIQYKYNHQCVTKNLILKIQKPANFGSILINSDRILCRKALVHLMNNAVKFTPKGFITLSFETSDNTLSIKIKDTGIGIKKESLDLIFTHFMQEDYSSTRQFDGSGLGLAIVKGLADRLGGSIRVTSEPGAGSIFTFTIPYTPANTKPVSIPVLQPREENTSRPFILVAEDEPYGCLFLEKLLGKDFEILLVEDGEEAVEICGIMPGIQLVLMDIKMPKMNGLDATREIKKFRNDLPIIALTAYAQVGDQEKCLEAGCDGYLSKPISKEELMNELARFGFGK